ncbi:non-homologous end-joining DNA ligase [Dactylosporangium sp. NPDC050688]|uniref:non-homologous end-joining DNA ligase n=1 Tax=Dactylosporangium sp. NPDC050688 TaxID=3157217 RepID=UPI0033DF52EE
MHANRDAGENNTTGAEPAALPVMAAPMLATPGPVPSGAGWWFEFKWDGVRAVVASAGGRVMARSRNDRDFTRSYPELSGLPAQLGGRRVLLDGELVALDEGGRPQFARLQDRMHVQTPTPALLTRTPVRLYVFDLLALDGEPTIELPYEQRRTLLESLGLPRPAGLPSAGDTAGGVVAYVPERFDDGPRTVAAARAFGLEGVMAKQAGSIYQPGRRSPAWVKHPFANTADIVIIGHRPGQGRRAGTIGSLLMALPEADGTLRFAGGVGTGFRDVDLHHLQQFLAPLHRDTPPVPGVPRDHARGATWVEPAIVGEVAYRTVTPDGLLRHPSWKGLRPDKQPPPGAGFRPAPVAAPAETVVTGALGTADGGWRVEAVRRGDVAWFRVLHGDNVVDHLQLPEVQALLDAADVDLAGLQEVPTAA